MHVKPTLAGLGIYPGDECYDPNRPSWLSYFIPTPTEIACALAHGTGYVGKDVDLATEYPELYSPPTVTPPACASTAAGCATTPEGAKAITDQQAADQMAAWKAQAQAQIDALAAKLDAAKGCPWYQTTNSDTGGCQFGSLYLWLALAGGAAAFLYMRKGKGA